MAMTNNYILIVDDDEDIAETIYLILQNGGYRCAVARDGAEALSRLQTDPLPRLVLLDIMMPTMTGNQFRAAQLRDPRIACVPVVVMTGDSRAEAKAAELGVTKFLRKPLGMQELLAAVRDPV
jgi:CheY-like chemotaxis protein